MFRRVNKAARAYHRTNIVMTPERRLDYPMPPGMEHFWIAVGEGYIVVCNQHGRGSRASLVALREMAKNPKSPSVPPATRAYKFLADNAKGLIMMIEAVGNPADE